MKENRRKNKNKNKGRLSSSLALLCAVCGKTSPESISLARDSIDEEKRKRKAWVRAV
jgi:hypothetical protein